MKAESKRVYRRFRFMMDKIDGYWVIFSSTNEPLASARTLKDAKRVVDRLLFQKVEASVWKAPAQ